MLFNRTIHSFKDARRIAKQRLPWMVFDYIDGAAGSGYSEQLNRETLQKLWLKQQILKDVQKRNIAVPLFTTRPKLPFVQFIIAKGRQVIGKLVCTI
jgi:isopentenyl diphosphate isomerase/L-lactate dehydrogenase-like FMN-dependent dehydrogenase